MPVSVSGNNKYLIIYYQISSTTIELAVLRRKAGNTTSSMMLKYAKQQYFDTWNEGVLGLDSDVEAIQLVARKTGVTTNVEYVLVDAVEIVLSSDTDTGTSNMPLQCLLLEKYYVSTTLFQNALHYILTCNRPNAILSVALPSVLPHSHSHTFYTFRIPIYFSFGEPNTTGNYTQSGP